MVQTSSMLFVVTILLLCHCKCTTGIVSISPAHMASVCGGDQLELICTTTGSFLEWSFSLIPTGETTAMTYSRILTALSSSAGVSSLILANSSFTLSRISAQNTLPLISRLLINPVSAEPNGIEVNCADIETSETASTLVQIINEDLIFDPQVAVRVMTESLDRDGVRVTLEWTQANQTQYSYNISINQNIVTTALTETTFQLEASYDISYNVSIITIPRCGQRIVTTTVELYYASANCQNPEGLVHKSIIITGNTKAATRGRNVTLSCTMGQVLAGPRLSTCMGNGEWEPDPREALCVHVDAITTQMFDSEALSQEGKIAVASSVTIFAVTALLFFIIGFLSGLFCPRKSGKPANGEVVMKETPIYDDVELKQQEHELELKENVA